MLALAYRKVGDSSSNDREVFEKDLTLLGFVLFENRLKAQTFETIQSLREADLKLAMITGDHILTAMNVAFSSGILQHSQQVRVMDLQDEHLMITHYSGDQQRNSTVIKLNNI